MANKLNTEKKIMATSMLCEGNSIRSIERMTGVHRDTIMRLGVRIGQGCADILDTKMRDLDCQNIQVDEMWGLSELRRKQLRITTWAMSLVTFGHGLLLMPKLN